MRRTVTYFLDDTENGVSFSVHDENDVRTIDVADYDQRINAVFENPEALERFANDLLLIVKEWKSDG